MIVDGLARELNYLGHRDWFRGGHVTWMGQSMPSLGLWLEIQGRGTFHPSEMMDAKGYVNSVMLLPPGRKALSREGAEMKDNAEETEPREGE